MICNAYVFDHIRNLSERQPVCEHRMKRVCHNSRCLSQILLVETFYIFVSILHPLAPLRYLEASSAASVHHELHQRGRLGMHHKFDLTGSHEKKASSVHVHSLLMLAPILTSLRLAREKSAMKHAITNWRSHSANQSAHQD